MFFKENPLEIAGAIISQVRRIPFLSPKDRIDNLELLWTDKSAVMSLYNSQFTFLLIFHGQYLMLVSLTR